MKVTTKCTCCKKEKVKTPIWYAVIKFLLGGKLLCRPCINDFEYYR